MTRTVGMRFDGVRTLRVRSVALLSVAVFLFGMQGAASLLAETKAPARITGKNGHVFIIVPEGSYEIGAKGHERNPLRTVTLKSYAIAEAETTNAQFAAFVEATGYVTDAEKRGSGKVAVEGMPDWAWDQIPGAHWRKPFGDRGKSWDELKDHPVTQISGTDAAAYCAWLGGRLPTLPEWEVAARAGKTTRYPWGNKYDMKLANTWNGESHLKDTKEDGHLYTAPVKSFPPNAWGLYDVIGNVFEYCTGLPAGARPGEEKRLVAGRGGSWWCSSNTCSFFNLVDIGQMDRHGSLANQGFRVVVDVTK
ncbi:SUMF1/EgtB/PvdO family nonheme iron enzyme [Roseimicrobium sp. ORNL1]|uniref:formylglycine-generating enzyme family protein n=1 Tax=Roseimicrobium sp. ORNL1 TaxID=2711231 RepID=UPI00197D28A8|nr:SUMF1/EgtB/PvdO family nonheme iron enzyme [Roseimicrobium sp. ORNL1]